MDGMMLRQNENGEWEKYEPYAVINVDTEEDYDKLQDILKTHKQIKSFMRALHDAGGCDASDEESKGWDKAIDEAIRLAEQYFGISIEDSLEECCTCCRWSGTEPDAEPCCNCIHNAKNHFEKE